MAVEWINPKTNWRSTEPFELEDFNRIKNNIIYLSEHLTVPIELEDMGADVTLDQQDWEVEYFNAIENNLHNINNAFQGGSIDIGLRKTFYRNGLFINSVELNRIEKAQYNIKNYQERVKAHQRRLPFALGRFKTLRV